MAVNKIDNYMYKQYYKQNRRLTQTVIRYGYEKHPINITPRPGEIRWATGKQQQLVYTAHTHRYKLNYLKVGELVNTAKYKK